MSKQLLAVDIGAGSGRIVCGSYDKGKLTVREGARFTNELQTDAEGRTYWDFERLSASVNGYLKQSDADSIGFDSFSPDFGIFDPEGTLCQPMLSYHNYFSCAFPEEVLSEYPADVLRSMTGNEVSPLSILARLIYLQKRYAFAADGRNTLLPMADALAFRVCGQRYTDFTFSFDSGLNDLNGAWDEKLVRFLKAGMGILPRVLPCGQQAGYSLLTPGKKTAIINTALHDTASAYHALKLIADGQLCMNAGTWFSVGAAADSPVLTDESRALGIENIALPDRTFIHGHTFPGAWFLQTFRKESGGTPFSLLSESARNERGEYISADVSNIGRYQNEKGLIETVREDLSRNGIAHASDAQVLRSIYEGLADAVACAIVRIEAVGGKRFHSIYMSGGVTKDSFLCGLIGEKSRRKIVPCMREASAAGNLLLQLQGLKLIRSADESRELLQKLEEQE